MGYFDKYNKQREQGTYRAPKQNATWRNAEQAIQKENPTLYDAVQQQRAVNMWNNYVETQRRKQEEQELAYTRRRGNMPYMQTTEDRRKQQEWQKASTEYQSVLADYNRAAENTRRLSAVSGPVSMERQQQIDQARQAEAAAKQRLDETAERRDALKIDDSGFTDWEGRDALVKEYKDLQNKIDRVTNGTGYGLAYAQEAKNYDANVARLEEVRRQLEEGDRKAGNGAAEYSERDRDWTILTGKVKQWGGQLANTALTLADFMAKDYAQRYNGLTERAFGVGIADAYAKPENRAGWDKLYAAADRISDSATTDLEKAKIGLGKLGQAGVDMAGTVLDMGFDAVTKGRLVTMFARVFGDSAREARKQGATLEQQVGYGIASGGIEVLTEKLSDFTAGIYGKGAADKISETVIRRLSDSPTGQNLLRVLLGFNSEGMEEVLSDLLQPFAQKIYKDKSLGQLFREIDPADVLYDYLLGGAVGGTFTALNTIGGGSRAQNAENDYITALYEQSGERPSFGREVRDRAILERQAANPDAYSATNLSTEENAQEAMRALRGQQTESARAQELRQAQETIRQQDAGSLASTVFSSSGITLDDNQRGRLMGTLNDNDISAKNFAIGTRDAYNMGEQGATMEETVQAMGEKYGLTPKQARTAWSFGASNAQTTATGTADVSTEEGRTKVEAALSFLGDRAADAVKLYDGKQDVGRMATAMNKAVLYAAHGADVQQAVQNAQEGKAADVVGVLTDEQAKLAQEIGAERRARQQAADKALGESYREMRQKAAAITGTTTVSAQALEAVDTAIDATRKTGQRVMDEFNELYNALEALEKADPNAKNSVVYQDMLDRAYKLRDKAQNAQKQIRDLEKRKAQIEGKKTIQRRKGTVSFGGGTIEGVKYDGVDTAKLSRQQQKVVAMVERLADAVNLDYVFISADAGMGGAYTFGGRVYININAGLGVGDFSQTMAAASLSHEMTHWMQQYAPEEYSQLKDFIVQEILKADPQKLQKLIQQQKAWEKGRALTDEQALDEVVANACQTMLLDSKAINKLARQNMSLAARIADWIADWSQKVRDAFAEVDTSQGAIYEALRALDGSLDRIQELWDNGIEAAAQNYDAQQTAQEANVAQKATNENAAQNIGDVQRQAWSEAEEDYRQEQELETQIQEAEDALDFEDDEKVRRSLENRLVKLRADYDKLVAKERRLSKKTSIDEILNNLSRYRYNDLESIANQFSDGAWDIEPGTPREQLEEELREALEERAADMTPLQRQAPREGFFVRPAETRGQFQTWEEEGLVYNGRAVVSEETVDRWLKDYAASNPKYAQAYIAYMSPLDYLQMTTGSYGSRQLIRNQAEGLSVEHALDFSKEQPIQLMIDSSTGKVEGHEGRHRMVALERAGIDKVPVLMFDSRNKYSKAPMESITLTGQDFNGNENSRTAVVSDVQPLSRENRDTVLQKFSKKSAYEKIGERYGRKTAQFQMIGEVEETPRLVAVHNKSVSGLRRMLQRGGVPFPSIAIKKAGTSHEGFGDVSIVFPRETIDPAASRWNRLYSNDAWTPTEPRTEYEADEKITSKVKKAVEKLVGSTAYNALNGSSYLHSSQVERALLDSNGDVFDAFKSMSVVKYAYLKSKGQDVELPTREKPLDGSYRYKNSELKAVFDEIDGERLATAKWDDAELAGEIADILNRQYEQQLQNSTSRNKDKLLAAIRKNPLYSAADINLSTIRYAYETFQRDGGKFVTETDSRELDNVLRNNKAVESDPEYKAWIEQTFQGVVKNEGIPNGKDLYTDSGNMRSFKARHVPATLENIVQQMRKENERGNGLFGVNLRGAATKAYSSVEEMRQDAGKLLGTHVSDEVYDGIMEGFHNRLHEMASAATKYPDRMSSYDTARDVLLEAVRDAKSKAAMSRMLQKESDYIKYTPELADELWTLRNDVQNMPAPYFEAKPRRIVYPDEALAYILPDNADSDVMKALEDKGYNVLTYKAGDEADRLRKLNSVEGAQFQRWDNTDGDTAAEANGREEAYTRLQSENKAVEDTIKALRKLTEKQGSTIERLRKRLKLTTTPEVREADARKLARNLVKEYGSGAELVGITEQLKALGDYVAQTKDLDADEVKNRAREIARGIVESASEQVSFEDEALTNIRGSIKGKKLTISPDFLGELAQENGFDAFRKRNFGAFTLARADSTSIDRSEYTSVSQFYTDLQSEYGKAYFPDLANEGEEIRTIAAFARAVAPMEVNPFEQYMGEATEELANRISMEVIDGALRLTPATDADKAKSRREALQERIRELQREGKIQEREAKDYERTIQELTDTLDKAQSRYRTLQVTAEQRMAQVRAEGRERAAEAMARERARGERKNQKLKEHYQEIMQAARERRQEAAGAGKYRKQIEKKAAKLYEMLAKNDDKLHVPEVLKQPLGEFLESLDFTSKRGLAGGEETQKDKTFALRLQKIQQILTNQQDYINGGDMKQDLGGYIDVSEANLDFLRRVSEMITTALSENRDFTINQMTAADLKDLSNFLSNLTTAIRNMNYFMANARFESVREAASRDIESIKALGKASETENGMLFSAAVWENGTPYYVFRRFGEGGKAIFDSFTRGWEKMAFNVKKVMDFTEETYSDKEVRDWQKERHEIELEDGSKVTMTTGQIMSLSMLLNREQARKHMDKGGVRIGDIQGKKGAIKDITHYHLTETDVSNIIGQLTDRQAEVARKLQRFMAEQGAEWGNEISMRRFGYNFYTEGENYFPIKTDSADQPMRDTDAQQNSMFRLLNLSASKSLNPKASNALVVEDIFDVFADHMSDMAKLNGMGLPILDAIKWFNYKERIDLGDGQYDTRTMQGAMEQAFGDKALSYFRTLMKDINGVTESGDRGADPFARIVSKYKAAAVAANLRVAFLQPTSYVRASYLIKPRYLMQAFTNKNAYKEAMENSGTAVWKSLGYYDTNIARGMRDQIKHNESWKDKVVEKSMGLAELGDKLTWGRLWVACKMQAAAETGLQGEELKQKTADLFREVIYSSQVMDSTLTRSELMRGKSMHTKALTAFMAEPTLSYNMVMDAGMEYHMNARKYGKAEAWQRSKGYIAKAFTVYACSAAFSAVVESIADAFRDDDDEESFLLKWSQAMFGEGNLLKGNLVQDLDLLGKQPYLRNAMSLLQGYKNRDMSVAALEVFIDTFKIWKETIDLATGALEKPTKTTYYGNMTTWGKIYKTMQALSQATGLAAANLSRDVFAVWNTTVGAIKPEWKMRTYESSGDRKRREAVKELTEQGVPKKLASQALREPDADGNGSLKQDELGPWLNEKIESGELTGEQADAIWGTQSWSTGFSAWSTKAEKAEAKAQAITDLITPAGIRQDEYDKIIDEANADGSSLTQDELGEYLRKEISAGRMSKAQAEAVWNTRGWKKSFGEWQK